MSACFPLSIEPTRLPRFRLYAGLIVAAVMASAGVIRNVFLGQGLGIIFLASGSGFGFALWSAAGLNHFLLKYLPVTAVPIQSFFLFTPAFFCGILFLLLALSALVLFFPARYAARLFPLAALQNTSV